MDKQKIEVVLQNSYYCRSDDSYFEKNISTIIVAEF